VAPSLGEVERLVARVLGPRGDVQHDLAASLERGEADTLVVLSREVGDAGGGWAADRGVAAVMVVVVEPVGQGGASLGLGSVGAVVGPLVEQGAVEVPPLFWRLLILVQWAGEGASDGTSKQVAAGVP
jgi:hypothetical protein